MPAALLVYATTHGHTTKIASRIADVLREGGLSVDMHDVRYGRETGRTCL